MPATKPIHAIIIPSYNEGENLPWVIKEAFEELQKANEPYEVVVIDDASTDDTPQILATLQQTYPELTVIRNTHNIGCHPSTLIGWRACQAPYQWFIPGDGQIPANELHAFLAKAKEGHDVVYSWRVDRADPFHRRLISQIYNLLVRTLFGIPVHDADSSSLLTKHAIDTILPKLRSDSAFITVEILIESRDHNLPIGEVNIGHRPRTAGIARGVNIKDLMMVPLNLLSMVWWFWQRKFK